MGEFMAHLFIHPSFLPGGSDCGGNSTIYSLDPTDPLYCDYKVFGFIQVLMLLVVYAYVLFIGSNMISDGSELLLLVPSLKGIVGSVVLPVLGAVPDGAIVLFSGLGPDAQDQVAVGVGTLAGSTIMLLTVPFILSIVAGRVDIGPDGQPQYSRKKAASRQASLASSSSCSDRSSRALFHTAVSPDGSLKRSARIMFASALVYLIVQIPVFKEIHDHGQSDISDNADTVHVYTIVGFVLCLIGFVLYLWYQVRTANVEDAVDRVTREALGKKLITMTGAFVLAIAPQELQGSEAEPLMTTENLRNFLHSFFLRYDINRDGHIDATELRLLFTDLNEPMDNEKFHALMNEMDKDHNGQIEFNEFATAFSAYMQGSTENSQTRTALQNLTARDDAVHGAHGDSHVNGANENEEDEEEEEEMPEDIKVLTPAQQQRAIKLRSAWMMGLGTLLVLLFSDPMVDVLSELAVRIDVPPFYVAFVLAPLASNASELIAAYNYALKKSKKTITIALMTLAGAATMNNTFSLGIFFLLIFVRHLAWEFSAETISVLIIQVCMVLYMHKSVLRLIDGIVIISFYPMCLLIVALLEGPGGLN